MYISSTSITIAILSVALVISALTLRYLKLQRFKSLVEILTFIKKEIQRDRESVVFLDTGSVPIFLEFSTQEEIIGAFEYIQELLKGFRYEVHNFDLSSTQDKLTFLVLPEDHQEKEEFNIILTYALRKRKEQDENKFRLVVN